MFSRFLVLSVIVLFVSGAKVFAGGVGVLTDNQGKPVLMTYDKALKACPAGTHLPTAKVFAEDNGGALGQTTPFKVYVPHYSAVNPDGSVDDFFYSPAENGSRTNALTVWTSSLTQFDSGLAYAFSSSTGRMGSQDRKTLLAVQCTADLR